MATEMHETENGSVDFSRDRVVDALLGYVRAKAHAEGARTWADACSRAGRAAAPQRRALESAEIARGYLHALAMALFSDPDDALAHEAFVEDFDTALAESYAAGLDGEAPEPSLLDEWPPSTWDEPIDLVPTGDAP